MKVLFVGEGTHDIGGVGEIWARPRPATGVVPTLARRVCPTIGDDSIALAWREIPRFSRHTRKGFEAKVASAMLLSARKLDCAGTVCVVDRDGDESRLPAMKRRKVDGSSALGVPHPITVGIAVESIEAWTLGAQRALAEELAVELPVLQRALPKAHVEELRESSGREERRPKSVIRRLAELTNRCDGFALRTAVASKTSPEELSAACPSGFAPFAEELRAAFQSIASAPRRAE